MFRGLLRMHAKCELCEFKYERAPGYFLGSTYINYGLTAVSMTILYVALHYGAGLTNKQLAVPLVTYCVLFPLLTFRYSRALWLGMDCYFDSTGFQSDPD